MRRRTLAVIAVVAAAATACGPSGPLDGVGELSQRWLAPATTTTTTVAVAATAPDDSPMVSAGEVIWFNDDLPDQATGDPEAVVAEVWARHGSSRFVQASRSEIAAAMPTITFPSRLPADVRWVTSQLVFDQATGTLDVDTAAAFGFWLAEPYSTSQARSMVLRVGLAPADVPPTRSDITPILVPEGITLIWTDSGLRYELFCRSTISEDLCLEVASSSASLSAMVSATDGSA